MLIFVVDVQVGRSCGTWTPVEGLFQALCASQLCRISAVTCAAEWPYNNCQYTGGFLKSCTVADQMVQVVHGVLFHQPRVKEVKSSIACCSEPTFTRFTCNKAHSYLHCHTTVREPAHMAKLHHCFLAVGRQAHSMHGLVWVQGHAYSTDAALQLFRSYNACASPVFHYE